jgi:hypothetical protein
VGSHDVHDDVAAKLGEIVRSNNGVVIFRQDEIEPSLVLDDVLDSRTVLKCPFHVCEEAREAESSRFPVQQDILDQALHRSLIEMTFAQIRIFPRQYHELACRLGGRHINATSGQTAQVRRTMVRIDDVEGTVTLIEPLLDVREKNLILFITGVKEGTHVSRAIQVGSRQPDWLH